MKQIKTYSQRTIHYWTDSRGYEHDIQKMSDDYLINCIVFLGRRVQILQNLKVNNKVITQTIKDYKGDLGILLKEVSRREIKGIQIPRGERCEDD